MIEMITMKTYIHNGYERVCLTKNKKPYFKRINRLVAESFIENSLNYPIIDHIDRNKLNNNLENLRWCNYRKV